MSNVVLYPHQKEGLRQAENLNHIAFYWDMGLGKTFVGAEKLMQLGSKINLVICQKSKIQDWIDHFIDVCKISYIYNLTNKQELNEFLSNYREYKIGIINYDLVFRRPELKQLKDFTLLLDESSLIQHETAKRSKFILKLSPKNVILLSGTPTGGKYENLWSQLHLLGWKISKDMFYNQYINYHWDDSNGFPLMVIDGYKNEERLKRKMRDHGCQFLKTEGVFDLPEQIHQSINIPVSKEYKKFHKDSIITINDQELVGDTTLTKMLYERQLCGQYCDDKLDAFADLINSTNDCLIVFYNFNEELHKLRKIAEECGREIGFINGSGRSMYAYEECTDGILFVQYQAGAMGLNLQKANKIVYFTPPLSSELFEQSKKRIHRIGQDKTCFYYYLTCKGSIEEKIYKTLAMRRDYTEALFELENHTKNQ